MGRWAIVRGSPLENETLQTYGDKVLQAGSGIAAREPEDIVSTDLKLYEAGGYNFAIAQAEVTDLMQLDEYLDVLFKVLQDLKNRRALDFAMLMVTDVVQGSSTLLLVNEPPILSGLPYPKQIDNTRFADGVVSRKKQLLPVVLGLLDN